MLCYEIYGSITAFSMAGPGQANTGIIFIKLKDGKRRSFRQSAQELARMGHLNERGRPYNAASIKAMIDRPMPSGSDEPGA